MMRITITYILLVLLPLAYPVIAVAQTDSSQKQLPEKMVVDSGMQKIELTPLQTQALQDAVSNPVWYLLTQIAPIFNIGAYYSYLAPTGSFGKQVSGSSAFSFDIGINLTRIFGEEESSLHWLIGMNADYTNFGKSPNNFYQKQGDTSYSTVIKNSLEVYSYYLEAEYRRSFIAPFASIAYSRVRLNPYKETETKIRNSTTNYSETSGDYLSSNKAHGLNLALGLKVKYRFNTHKELMALAKVSYLRSTAIDMIDLNAATFNTNGQLNSYQTINVNPNWLMYTLGIKYNF
jgi:hypothetical protein